MRCSVSYAKRSFYRSSNAVFCKVGGRASEEVILQLECGPMPNVMVALPNIGGALCSTPQSLADAHYLTDVQ